MNKRNSKIGPLVQPRPFVRTAIPKACEEMLAKLVSGLRFAGGSGWRSLRTSPALEAAST